MHDSARRGAVASPRMKALGPGARVADRYVLETVIARGGMGAVFRAVDERLGRTVAIKLLLAELAEDETSLARFEREASATARLTHPSIVQVYDFGKYEGVSYIVMELVVGRTLASELDTLRRIEPHRACDLVEQALGGISAAHELGIVHRDLKPGNIMIVPTGAGREVVKVLDFGIAQLKQSAPYVRLTQTGAVLGTPTFMSPEQARGETSDPRTDVYAMGVVLWCCLTGQRPFAAADVPTTLGKVLGEMPPRADKIDPAIPAAIAHATERAMEKRPSARYPTAAAFAQALMDARESSAIPATVAVSLPPEPRTSTSPDQTGPVRASSASQGAAITRVGVMAASTTPARSTVARPGWQRWAIAGVVVAVVAGVGIGGLVVLGVVELERGGVDVGGLSAPQFPTTIPTTPAPLAPPILAPTPPPSHAPTQGAPVDDPCGRLRGCCHAYQERIRPSFPDCDQFVSQLEGDAALCTQRIEMFQHLSGESVGEVPPECL